MARIKIEDLEPLAELTDEELSGAVGGVYVFDPSVMYDAWNPTNALMDVLKASTYDQQILNMASYDAWMPGG